VAEIPSIKRYALVPSDGDTGPRRFHLARVASDRPLKAPSRLERMEEVAARELGFRADSRSGSA
jgi:hypothetical protein